MIKIAIDAMGGTYAPEEVVKGAKKALASFPDIEIQLYGPENKIAPFLSEDLERLQIRHTDTSVGETDDIFEVLKNNDNASITEAIKSVKNQECDGAISAGSTSATFVAALSILGVFDGLTRPGIVAHLNTISQKNPKMVICDPGANAEVKAKNLEEFAIMGKYYAENILAIENPRVGLLSNGTEDTKGTRVRKKAFPLLKDNPDLNFIGNVEPHGLMDGICDVLVTDGFAGNIYTKQYEEMSEKTLEFLEKKLSLLSVKDNPELRQALEETKDHFDTDKTLGGALLSGVEGVVFLAHGRAKETAIFNAIKNVRQAIEKDYVTDVQTYFQKIK